MDGDFDCDLFVIGAGSGGVRAAVVAANLGARVIVAEAVRLGGTCVNLGCVPKKLLVYASSFSRDFEDARGFGWTASETRFDWAELIRHKDAEIERLNGHYAKQLDTAGVELLRGRACVTAPQAVEVNGRALRARHVLVATGGRPIVPEIPGAELGAVSDQAFHLERLPERVLIVGGGYIGVEFAGIFHGLGASVTLSCRNDAVLRGFDEDVRAHVTASLKAQGIDVRCGSGVVALERAPSERSSRPANGELGSPQAHGELVARLADGATSNADFVLFATGRGPNTQGLGLDTVGAKLNAERAVVVDAFGQSSLSWLHAVGDVHDGIALTPTAIAEGQAVAERLFGGRTTPADLDGVPTAVFGHPQIACVGLTEAEARERGHTLRIYRTSFRPMKSTLSGRTERGLMKLVVDAPSDRVLGVHIVGAESSELVQGFAVALKCGATKAQLDATLGIHPTSGEELLSMRTPVAS